MVTTIHGDMKESDLVRSEGIDETPDAFVRWVEYRLPKSDEIVHRSIDVEIKHGVGIEAVISKELGG